MMKTRNVILCILIFCLSVLLLLAGCSKKGGGTVVVNTKPHVKVSGGPPQRGISNYSVPIYWFGWDDDGVVDHFVYAIDDTTSWIETKFFQGSFLFSADSVRSGEEFGRWHTFWIKAIDNPFSSRPGRALRRSRPVIAGTRVTRYHSLVC